MASTLDVQMLQTAASLENLAVEAYEAVARSRGHDPLLDSFVRRTRAQHAAHAVAFNRAAVRAGGREQLLADPRYVGPVRRALADQAGVAAVPALASLLETLEDAKAQTYARFASLSDPRLRSMFVSVAAVEAGHRAFLLAALKLLSLGEPLASGDRPAGLPDHLPADLGAGSCPHAFYPTTESAAVDEGVVR
jgi:uncharacterized protein (DUF2336 family)